MGKILDSINENLEHIEKALKGVDGVEFVAEKYASVAESETQKPSEESEKHAIVAQLETLASHPDVDEKAAIADFESAPDAHKAPPPLTADEEKAAIAAAEASRPVGDEEGATEE